MVLMTERPTLSEATAALLPRIEAAADEIERERRLPRPLVDAIAEAGLFRMSMPRTLGGSETDPLTRLGVIEQIARVDASVAWCVEIGSGTAYMMAGWLGEDVARQILCGSPYDVVSGTATVAAGRAIAVPGGYRVSGRWPWGSGCTHATWLSGGCVIMDGDQPRRGADGAPIVRSAVFPKAQAEIIDTWQSLGLRGSGSHDFAVDDIFVPAERTFSLLADPPAQPGPYFAFPGIYLSSAGALALGVGRAAVDALVELAAQKTPNRSTTLLRERPMVQSQVARAEALISSARAFLHSAVGEVWQTALDGVSVGERPRALYRLAITNAVQASVEAVDLCFALAGGSAVYARNPFERQFRDIHTLAQHAALAPPTLEPAGRMLLGLEPGAPFF